MFPANYCHKVNTAVSVILTNSTLLKVRVIADIRSGHSSVSKTIVNIQKIGIQITFICGADRHSYSLYTGRDMSLGSDVTLNFHISHAPIN